MSSINLLQFNLVIDCISLNFMFVDGPFRAINKQSYWKGMSTYGKYGEL